MVVRIWNSRKVFQITKKNEQNLLNYGLGRHLEIKSVFRLLSNKKNFTDTKIRSFHNKDKHFFFWKRDILLPICHPLLRGFLTFSFGRSENRILHLADLEQLDRKRILRDFFDSSEASWVRSTDLPNHPLIRRDLVERRLRYLQVSWICALPLVSIVAE